MGDTSQKTFEAAVQREYQGEWLEPAPPYTGIDRRAEPVKLSEPELETALGRLNEMIREAGDRAPPRPVAIHPAIYERLVKLLFEPTVFVPKGVPVKMPDGVPMKVIADPRAPSGIMFLTTLVDSSATTYDLQVGPSAKSLEAGVAKKMAQASEAMIAAEEAGISTKIKAGDREQAEDDEDGGDWRDRYVARKARAAGQRDEMTKHVHAELELRAEVERLQKLVASRGGDLQCLTGSLRSRESMIAMYQDRIKELENGEGAWQSENSALRARIAELEKARDQPRSVVAPDDYEKRLRGERTARDWSQVPAFVPAGRTKALPVMRGGPAKLPRPAVMHCQGDFDDDNEWLPEPPDPMEGCPW